ncbi:hypothetical protein EXIGLDRAFT_784372 [Exidia glandulosa HHB12029]|uniref:F-box domain-containing protein n=1 Tax=Exidia glandulosa HHB12029 TaxID=1314781 RepID=A0A166MHS7_EXIGL|nr:hypothetical protein EXIGLDRAFT_784372 [Exidia glandulosa HHB12029]
MALFLPPEMFPPIFANLKLVDLVRVSHVCSYWRSICLNAPSLWSDFDAAGCRRPFLEAIIARSKSMPLHLEANHDELYTADVDADELPHAQSESVTEDYFMTTFLPPLMVRMKSLFLSNFNRTMDMILAQPAPMLLALVLRSVNGHLCDGAIRGRDAPAFPNLKSLALDNITFCGAFTLGHFLLLYHRLRSAPVQDPPVGRT